MNTNECVYLGSNISWEHRTKQNVSKCPRNYFQDHSDTVLLWLPSPGKTQEPNDGGSHHKSKQRGELKWATAASCLPLLFSQWSVMCEIAFLCWYIRCTNRLIGWYCRAKSQGFSHLLPQTYLPSQVATWQPWRDAFAPLHSDCPSLALLHALHL